MLATGGGLVFTGKLTGEFVALDEDTGKTLWQFKTGSIDQLDGDHLHAQGPAVRDDRVWAGRRARESLRAGQGADGRLDLDVRVDAVSGRKESMATLQGVYTASVLDNRDREGLARVFVACRESPTPASGHASRR